MLKIFWLFCGHSVQYPPFNIRLPLVHMRWFALRVTLRAYRVRQNKNAATRNFANFSKKHTTIIDKHGNYVTVSDVTTVLSGSRFMLKIKEFLENADKKSF